MASDAEVDLVVNATRALGEVQRDLDRIVRVAQTTTDPVQLRAALDQQASLRNMTISLRRIIAEAEARAGDVDVPVRFDVDRDSFRTFDNQINSLRRLGGSAASSVGRLGASLAGLGAAAGAAAPLLAGVVAAAEQLAPAAAVATQGILAMQLASGTLKLALNGVEDAITTAFDPDASPEDLAKAMERLAPNARAFVQELRGMRSAFRRLQLDTQNLLFKDLAGNLGGLARRVLPVARDAIRNTAVVLNQMALSAANAAGELADNGTLRQALQGTVRGLRNLEDVPGRIVTGFGQLAAASAPAFARITQAVNRVTKEISEGLNRAFESGALTRAVDQAVSELFKLVRVARNVQATFSNVFRAVSGDGESLFDILLRITGQIREITASRGFQDTLSSLASVMRNIAEEVGPLLRNIFEELGPVFQRLSVPVNRLVDLLGENLNGVVDELGPVLLEASEAFDKISAALEPFVDLAFQIIREILPTLRPGLELLGEIFAQLAPGIARLTEALGPLIAKLFELQALIQEKVFQALGGMLEKITPLINQGLTIIAEVIENAVIPTLQIFIDLLNGDTTSAFNRFIALGNRVNEFVSAAFNLLKTKVQDAIRNMVTDASARFSRFVQDLVAQAQQKLAQVVAFFAGLPGRISSALGNLGNTLFSAGQDIVNGMIAGVRSRINELIATLAGIASRARDTVTSILGIHSPSRVFAEIGDDMIAGLRLGLDRSAEALRQDLTGLALAMPQTISATPLAAPGAAVGAPTVQVFLGNQLLDRHVDTRIMLNNANQARRNSQGVRR